MPKSQPLKIENIQVSLDPRRDPPVTVDIHHANGYCAQEIIWEIDSKSRIRDFYFFRESVHFNENAACFIKAKTHKHDKVLSIYNTFTSSGVCTYSLMVEYDGKYYTTNREEMAESGDPCIHNK